MANEADLKLIEIPQFPPTTTLEGTATERIPVTKADGVTYSISTEDLKAFLGTVQVQVPKALAPTDPSPTLSGVYYPTITQDEAGTPIVYDNAGGIEVNTAEGGEDYGKQVQFLYDNEGGWTKVGIPLPEVDLSGLATKAEVGTIESRLGINTTNLFSVGGVVTGLAPDSASGTTIILTGFQSKSFSLPVQAGNSYLVIPNGAPVNRWGWALTNQLPANGVSHYGGNLSTASTNPKTEMVITVPAGSSAQYAFIYLHNGSNNPNTQFSPIQIFNSTGDKIVQVNTKVDTVQVASNKNAGDILGISSFLGLKNAYPSETFTFAGGFTTGGYTIAASSNERSIYMPINSDDYAVLLKNQTNADRMRAAYTVEEPNVAGVKLYGGYLDDGVDDTADRIDTRPPKGVEVNWLIFYLYRGSGSAMFNPATLAIYKNPASFDSNPSSDRYLFGDFSGTIDPAQPEPFDILSSTAADIYAEWDNLMVEYPNRITKRLLDYATSVDGTQDLSHPIYEYVVKSLVDEKEPDNLRTGLVRMTPAPVFAIMSGVHGDEKSPPWAFLQLMKQTLSAPPSATKLATLNANATYKTIPILNPAGYDLGTRANARGVDLNRSFTNDPPTELETQVGMDWINENKDCFAYIDYHNLRYWQGGYSYFAGSWSLGYAIYSSLIRVLSNKWKSEFIGFTDNNIEGFLEPAQPPLGTTKIYASSAGITRSCTLEISRTDQSGAEYTAPIVKIAVDLIANYLLAVLGTYNRP